MADIKKFLDQTGVSVLWTRVLAKIKEVDAKTVANALNIDAHNNRIEDIEDIIESLEKDSYDDTDVRNLIATNTQAITLLNGEVDITGSVANTAATIAVAEVAKIVNGAPSTMDTLLEVANWIDNDETGAAAMTNAISELQTNFASFKALTEGEIDDIIDAASNLI